MRIIKNIIAAIIAFFKNLFHKDKKKKRKNISVKKNQKIVVPMTKLPECFYIDNDGKENIINSLKLIYERINSNVKDDLNTLNEKLELKSFHDNLIHDNINKNYNYIIINNLISNVEKNKISYYLASQLDNLCENILSIKNLNEIENEKIIKFSELFKEIIKESDDYIISKTRKEYDKINYITINNVIIDEVSNDIEKLNDDLNKHRHNKYYYDKKIRKLKRRILELEKIKEKDLVWNEILILRNDFYTKSKDKYDLLYNDEVYINLIKKCDLILDQVNKKIVDIKKDNKVKKETKKNKTNDLLSLKIYKRYEDLAIARKKILLNEEKFIYPNNKEELIKYIDNLYSDFLEKDTSSGFNYQRNLIKYKVVILNNNLTKIICSMTGDGYIPLEHINTKMDYILQDTYNKKQYLELIIHQKDNYESENSIKVDEKINKLIKKESGIDIIKKEKTYVKKINNKRKAK